VLSATGRIYGCNLDQGKITEASSCKRGWVHICVKALKRAAVLAEKLEGREVNVLGLLALALRVLLQDTRPNFSSHSLQGRVRVSGQATE
jgi:hypothetical protein